MTKNKPLLAALGFGAKLTPQQRGFTERLAKDPKHNQTAAAKAMGYKFPTQKGCNLMRNHKVRAYYTALLQAAVELGKPEVLESTDAVVEITSIAPYGLAAQTLRAAMDRSEIVRRLADQASVNMLDFVSYEPTFVLLKDGTSVPVLDKEGRPVYRPYVDLEKATRLGKGHLIKKLKVKDEGTEIELVDSQGALKILYGDDAPIGPGSRERSWKEALAAMPPQFVLALHARMLQGSAIPTTARVVGGNGGGNGHG